MLFDTGKREIVQRLFTSRDVFLVRLDMGYVHRSGLGSKWELLTEQHFQALEADRTCQ